MSSIADLLLYAPIVLLSVVVHEYAHARVAVWQGDNTPLEEGRLSLNPLKHIDPVGTILIPLLLLLSRAGFLFGWARPVRIQSANFRNFRRADILVSIAGVAANFALALLCTVAVVALVRIGSESPDALGGSLDLLERMARLGILFNVILAVFNLLPIPPLDGSHIVYHLLPRPVGRAYMTLGRFSVLLLAVVLLVPGALGFLLRPVDLLVHWANRVIDFLA